jgi:hypothetical protein
LQIRINDEFFAANWKTAMDKISKIPFCMGQNDRGWKASFDWFLTPDAVVKIIEGKYDALKINGHATKHPVVRRDATYDASKDES